MVLTDSAYLWLHHERKVTCKVVSLSMDKNEFWYNLVKELLTSKESITSLLLTAEGALCKGSWGYVINHECDVMSVLYNNWRLGISVIHKLLLSNKSFCPSFLIYYSQKISWLNTVSRLPHHNALKCWWINTPTSVDIFEFTAYLVNLLIVDINYAGMWIILEATHHKNTLIFSN